MSLNSKYFKLITKKIVEGVKYNVVRPKGSHMILFSKVDGSPLASLCLESHKGIKTVISKRYTGDTDFQGMIAEDNQEFKLIITNLNQSGLINFNIMKNDTPVCDVDPGAVKGGLNQVNELNAFQSYAIRCDQKDNMSLVLNSIRKCTGENITVKEAELSPVLQGTKYYLSVVAEVGNPDLVAKFADTFWACVDVFCMKVAPRSTYEPSRARGALGDYRVNAERSEVNSLEGLSVFHSDEGMVAESSISRGGSRGFCAPASYGQESSGFRLMSTSADMDSVVNNSFAANVGGRRHIDVHSGCTGKTYAFETPSAKCSLGLSVVQGLTFMDALTDDELSVIADTMIDENVVAVAEYYKQQLEKVFESKNCVICLDDDSEPDSIFYACGHKCCHLSCSDTLRLCPMCRLSITAKIKA